MKELGLIFFVIAIVTMIAWGTTREVVLFQFTVLLLLLAIYLRIRQ